MNAPIIPSDAPSVFVGLNTLVLANNTQLAIIRPDNPPPGIAGFLLNIVTDDTFELESDITRYVTSENNPIQDHVSLMPETVTVSGEVAEVVQTEVTTEPVAPVGNPLPLVDGLQPQLTPGASATQQAEQTSALTDQAAVDSTQSLWGYYNQRLPQQPNQTKQSLVLGYLYQLWRGRQRCSVETPWGFMNSMMIQSVQASQGERTKWSSTFSVTFVKFRVAETITIQPGRLAGRAFSQWAPETNNGAIGQQTSTFAQEAQLFQKVTNPSP